MTVSIANYPIATQSLRRDDRGRMTNDMKIKLGSLIGILFMCLTVQAADTSNADKIKQKLEKGDIITEIVNHPVTGVPNPTGKCLVKASINDVWYVITDFDSFGEFMPNAVFYQPVNQTANRLIVNCKIKIGLLYSTYKLAYIIDEETHTTYWSYVQGSGPIRDAQGYMRIEPYDDTRVLVTYTTTLDAGRYLPKWIETYLTKSTFPKIFSSLRQRIVLLKGRGEIVKPKLNFYQDEFEK
jgi:carbon monoxide dehydrogenase subunit G